MATFEELVSNAGPLSFDIIGWAAKQCLPPEYRSSPWDLTSRGTSIYTEQLQLNAYIAAYLDWHVGKLEMAFAMLQPPPKGKVDVVDWGCGQGLATLSLIFHIRQKFPECSVGEVVLIDPSDVALRRAQFLLGLAAPVVKVRAVRKVLNDVVPADVAFGSGNRVVHFFSNVLDLDGIDYKHVAQLTLTNPSVYNTVVCVSPYGKYKFASYSGYFKRPLAYELWKSKSKSCKADFACLIWVAGVLPSDEPQFIDCEFFAPIPMRAAYELSALRDLAEMPERLTCFDVYAPFDFVAAMGGEPHPLLAVVSNIVTRGLPTLPSPFIERQFGVLSETSADGVISFAVRDGFAESLSSALRQRDEFALSGDTRVCEAAYSPLAVARLETLLVEILLAGRLDLSADHWDVLVEEADVPCAALAFRDFRDTLDTLAAMTADFADVRMPRVNLTIVSNGRFADSALHLGERCVVCPSADVVGREYDLVISYSSSPCGEEPRFSRFKAQGGNYFAVFSAKSVSYFADRLVRTTDRIVYKECVSKRPDGGYDEDEAQVRRMEYFLRLLFRKESFRPGQLPILSRAMAHKPVIGLLPTGGGKSLTYQLAALLQPGVTLVVDPLKSLMKDQFDGLLRLGIDSCTYINSSVPDLAEREDLMAMSCVQFVFLSPERLCIAGFRSRLTLMSESGVYFAYGVIDEVHCVSEWGHDFRFSYLHLGRNLYNFVLPKPAEGEKRRLTLFGLTATASFDVLADVERELSGNGAFPLDPGTIVRYENTNRLELQYRVVPLDDDGCNDDKAVKDLKSRTMPLLVRSCAVDLRRLLSPDSVKRIKRSFLEREGVTDEAVVRRVEKADLAVSVADDWYAESPNKAAAIVFCPHRSGAIGVNDSQWRSGVASVLSGALPGSRVCGFVGGDKLDAQEQFIAGDASIMVATKAFGMGIDKPNVRFTLHVGFSSSLESFVQEAGRAGRDRRMALATILYSGKHVSGDASADYGVHKFFYDSSFPGEGFEKHVLLYLLSDAPVDIVEAVQDDINGVREIRQRSLGGFLRVLFCKPVGATLTYEVSYSERDNRGSIGRLNSRLSASKFPTVSFADRPNEGEVKFIDAVSKAIYRMSCIGVIDDFTRDYAAETFRIVATRRSEDDYYALLKDFVMRYYAEERADAEVARAKERKGQNAIHRCLGYVADFVYSKIATKRRRAIADMELFCSQAVSSGKDWLEMNEDLKDFIYFYFNSKFARSDFRTDSGEPFSLTTDSDFGKVSSFDLLFKFMRVVDDDVVGASGSPKDNVKHLQGAVRLIRRSLTDSNPALDLLYVFCLLYLGQSSGPDGGQEDGSGPLSAELAESFRSGYAEFRARCADFGSFALGVDHFVALLGEKNAASPADIEALDILRQTCEAEAQLAWLEDFKGRYADV